MIRTASKEQPTVDKGWVRQGILSDLSKEPSTLTEVSRKLGVSKSTASYHLSLLLRKGLIELVGAREGRGGVSVKKYGIREGSLVVFPSAGEEEAELRRMKEAFELEILGWRARRSPVGLQDVQRLLYKLFLNLFRITRSEHGTLMQSYGSRTGAIMAEDFRSPPGRQAVLNLASHLRSGGIADVDVVEVSGSPVSVLVSNVCVGSDQHVSNSCYFLEGMVRGLVSAKLGANVRVGRVQVPGLSSCCFAVGRVRSLDLGWLAEAVISSPRYSAINRGRGRA